jgi:NADH dehydrogenase
MPLTIVVAGGSGFIGREVVARLAAAGHRVIVPARRRYRARELYLLPTVEVVECDVTVPATLARLLRGADALINLVGILNPSGRATFARVHVDFARDVVAACAAAGVSRYVHMSALNAAADAPSHYLRSKGEAEAIVAASPLAWTIFRPNVVFGRGDHLTSMFVGLAGFGLPLPLGGARAALAPVWVEDVAWCIARAPSLDATIGQRYELCGPEAMTLASLVRTTLDIAGRPRAIIPLPDGLARLLAGILERLPGKLLTRDNLASLSVPAVCHAPFPAVFGVEPAPFAALAPSWLGPGAERGEYDVFRARFGRD